MICRHVEIKVNGCPFLNSIAVNGVCLLILILKGGLSLKINLLFIHMYLFFMKCINLERKGNFKALFL